jgi:hypothetical protein
MEVSFEGDDTGSVLVVNLEKLSPAGGFSNAFPVWQRRCFVFSSDQVCYYKSSDAYLAGSCHAGAVPLVSPNPVDVMDHKMCTWQPDANDLEQKHAWGLFVEKEGYPSEMIVRTPWRDYRLRARSQEVVRKCHAALVRAGVPTFCKVRNSRIVLN